MGVLEEKGICKLNMPYPYYLNIYQKSLPTGIDNVVIMSGEFISQSLLSQPCGWGGFDSNSSYPIPTGLT
jgi:hypothetical protein